MVSSDTFLAQTPANHGSVTGTDVGADGDVRVNMTAELNSTESNILNTSTFTLSLWDANSGNGFSTAYNDPTGFSWALVFYDVDAGTPATTGVNIGVYTYDYIRLMTQGTYTVTNNTDLQITSLADGSVSFSGIDAGAVSGQDGLTTLTVPQRRASVVYEVSNTSSLQFQYAALRANSDPNDSNLGNNYGSGRNLLIDGGQLTSEMGNGTQTINIDGIPEPSSTFLLLLSTGSLLCRRQRK